MSKIKKVTLFLVLLARPIIMITALEGTSGNSLFSGNESPEGVSINEKYLNLARAISGKGASSSNDGQFSSAAIAAASKLLASNKVSAMKQPDFATEWPDSACVYSNSKSGKAGVGTKSNKIERFSTESGLKYGILSPASIYNGVMTSPGIRNPYVEGVAPIIDIDDVIANQTFTHLLILGDYLKCAGTKVENLLTVKLHVNLSSFIGGSYELTLLPIAAFLFWWFTVTGITLPEDIGIPGVTWNFPTFSIEYVIGIVPPVGGSIGGDDLDLGNYFVMFEATAAV